MKKILLTAVGLGLATVSYATNIDYKNMAQCRQAMDNYIIQAKTLPLSKSLAFSNWFSAFKNTDSSMSMSCINSNCVTTYIFGGCGTINKNTRFFYNFAKPILLNEIERLQQKTNSLPLRGKYKIICNHASNTTPIKRGQCKLA